MVCFSGHGIKQGEAVYFAPVGFDPNNAAGTGLPWKEVLDRLEGVRPTVKAVWLLAPPNAAATSLPLPCCSSTTTISRAQTRT